jgi:hypothetical protein
MVRRHFVGRCLLASFLAAFASGSAGASEIKAQAGQPFCQRLEDLQDYIIALLQHNADEAQRLDCGGLPSGARLVILEDLPTESQVGHAARVRAFILGGGGSLVGYTLIMNP